MNSKQISVMNSFMKIHVPEFVGEFMVSDNKHCSSCTEKFQLHFREVSVAPSAQRSFSCT